MISKADVGDRRIKTDTAEIKYKTYKANYNFITKAILKQPTKKRIYKLNGLVEDLKCYKAS